MSIRPTLNRQVGVENIFNDPWIQENKLISATASPKTQVYESEKSVEVTFTEEKDQIPQHEKQLPTEDSSINKSRASDTGDAVKTNDQKSLHNITIAEAKGTRTKATGHVNETEAHDRKQARPARSNEELKNAVEC